MKTPSVATQSGAGMAYGVLAVLSAAMFVYVIDTTLMNVSISALVADLDTTVGEVQTAITLYTLTMAAFMLTGGKLGDIWGSKLAFRIGLIVYGVGTTITAVAPSIGFVILGWSFLEGMGSALIVPAINTLVRSNYAGAKRATAYGVLFGVAAAGAAFGPLIGGWVTTEMSWRVAFAGEALIVVAVLVSSRLLVDAPPVTPRPKLDLVGVVLSVAGLALVVYGVLQTSSRGWRDPIVIGLLAMGAVALVAFWMWSSRREANGESVLLHPSIFKHRAINAGLPILSTQTFAQAGVLFLIPVFTQTLLGFDAFRTGLTLLPLSIGVLATSILTPPLGRRIYPKYIIQTGLLLLFVGGAVLARGVNGATAGRELFAGLLIVGLAIGIVAGQLPNLILSGVEQKEASEASGLQGTAQNLGMALGTAVVGTVVLSVGLASIAHQVRASDSVPPELADAVIEAVSTPFERPRPGSGGIEGALVGLPPDEREELVAIFNRGTTRGFQAAIGTGGLVALIGAGLAFRLPKRKLEPDASVETTVKEVVRTPTIPAVQFEMDELAMPGADGDPPP